VVIASAWETNDLGSNPAMEQVFLWNQSNAYHVCKYVNKHL
jgi:hypothetical protein